MCTQTHILHISKTIQLIQFTEFLTDKPNEMAIQWRADGNKFEWVRKYSIPVNWSHTFSRSIFKCLTAFGVMQSFVWQSQQRFSFYSKNNFYHFWKSVSKRELYQIQYAAVNFHWENLLIKCASLLNRQISRWIVEEPKVYIMSSHAIKWPVPKTNYYFL